MLGFRATFLSELSMIVARYVFSSDDSTFICLGLQKTTITIIEINRCDLVGLRIINPLLLF